MGLDPVVERMFQEKKRRGTGRREPDPDHERRLKGKLETPDLKPWVKARMTTVMETVLKSKCSCSNSSTTDGLVSRIPGLQSSS